MKRLAVLLSCLAALPTLSHAAEWEGAQDPFQLYGNSYYVGTAGLSSVLITSPAGHILIDGASPKAAVQIAAHIRQLGFSWKTSATSSLRTSITTTSAASRNCRD